MTASAPATAFAATDGDAYERQMGRWSRRLAPLLVGFAGIGGAVRVLDVGCGTGNLGACLARSPEMVGVHGVDVCAAYVEHARHRNSDVRLVFEVGDARALPFPDASFDHALSMLALQFVSQADVAVREMRRVTRRGGIVAAATWDTRGGLMAYRMIFDAAALLVRGGHQQRASACTRPMSRPGELARAWREAGLTDVLQDAVTIRMDFASFADYWTPAEGKDGPVAQFVGTLDREAGAVLRDAVKSAYLDGEDDGPRSYAATAWVVKGGVPN